MKRYFTLIMVCCFGFAATNLLAQDDLDRDWAYLECYQKANQELTQAPKVVFMGDSVTWGWFAAHPEFFKDNNFAARGISGQVPAQMLGRFQQDVVELGPKVVVIFAGINDVAQNNGYITADGIYNNLVSMAQIAKANKIKAIILPMIPTDMIPWRSEEFSAKREPLKMVNYVNAKLAEYAKGDKNCTILANIWDNILDGNGCVKTEYCRDTVHPNPDTYYIIEEAIIPVIKKLAK